MKTMKTMKKAGSVTDIVKIDAPASAAPGDTIVVYVWVKNLSADEKYIAVTGVYDSSPLSWLNDYLSVPPGETAVFRSYGFAMPNKKIRVTAYSFWWDGAQWVYDDTAFVDISLLTLTPQFSNFGIGEYDKV